MKRILIAINAGDINMAALDFACYLSRLTHSRLTGIFLEPVPPEEKPELKILHGNTYVESVVADLPKQETRVALREKNETLFKEACTTRGVNCHIHLDTGSPLEEIVRESRFADILVVDPEMTFEDKTEGTLSSFIKHVAATSECPVIIAPFEFYGIDEIVFAYDGSESSVYAIKQFSYLFPALSDKKVTVLQVNEGEEIPVVHKDKIGELLQMHYSKLGFRVLQGKPTDELFGYLLGKKNIFLVMGAFSRKIVSGLFRRSTAELIIKTVNLPVFIAHH